MSTFSDVQSSKMSVISDQITTVVLESSQKKNKIEWKILKFVRYITHWSIYSIHFFPSNFSDFRVNVTLCLVHLLFFFRFFGFSIHLLYFLQWQAAPYNRHILFNSYTVESPIRLNEQHSKRRFQIVIIHVLGISYRKS